MLSDEFLLDFLHTVSSGGCSGLDLRNGTTVESNQAGVYVLSAFIGFFFSSLIIVEAAAVVELDGSKS
jgi:hypothetical protein